MSDPTVLYIEDDTEMIDLVRLILSRKGIAVKGAEGGKRGLELVKTIHPDLVLLDLMMPDMDGWDVFQVIKSDPDTASIPCIIITARSQPIDRVLGLYIARVDDYLSKPFRPADLIASVEKVLHLDSPTAA
jgi:DNA-binding response OmpR family regulator